VAIGNPKLASGGSIQFLEKWSAIWSSPDRTSVQAKLPLENPLEREISPLDAPKRERKPRQGERISADLFVSANPARCSEKQRLLLDALQTSR
jgi:hypothetical protein